jgi:hypothetical protein
MKNYGVRILLVFITLQLNLYSCRSLISFFVFRFLNEFAGSSAIPQPGSGNGISDEYRNVNSIKEGEWKLNYNRW